MGNTHNIKLCLHIPPEPQDDDLVFAAQLGVDYVYTWIKEQNSDYRQLLKLKARVESYGLTLYNVGCLGLGKNDKVHLALPGRDEGITRFNRFLQNLGRAGIDTTTFTWEPAGVHSTSRETPARGGALARSVDMEELQKRPPLPFRYLFSTGYLDQFWLFYRAGFTRGRRGRREAGAASK